MRTIARHRSYSAPIEEVFERLDDLGVTGTHMTESSAMMMGSKLRPTYLSDNHIGLNTKYRWQGSMMGMQMDFTVVVTKWIRNKEKTWETVGETKLINLFMVSNVDGCFKNTEWKQGRVIHLV